MGLNIARKLAKASRLGIKRAFKSADLHLVIIACIEHNDVWIGYERVPILRRDIGADARGRISLRCAYGDDFFL